jgi:hypothetical protein
VMCEEEMFEEVMEEAAELDRYPDVC